MQNSMADEISMLKKNNALEAIEDKYNNIISQLKYEMEEEKRRTDK